MKKRTRELLARMKKLAAEGKENLWERIKVAAELVADHDWIASDHNGDELRAKDAIQMEYFHELNGTYTLGVLLAIYAEFPDESTWQEYRYNLSAMRALWEEARVSDEESRTRTSIKKADYDKVVEDLEVAAARAKQTQELLEKRSQELSELIAQNRELERENAILRGRIEELERLVSRQTA